ncbi:Polygalacturonase-1 non-catalytic subunit beta [Glycine soja]|nr:Polygalacturonase-1 non-catalytic subunit beta [Glycine soja]
MGVCSFDAGGFRRRRRRGGEKPVHPKSLRDSVLGQRDPQRVTEATVSSTGGAGEFKRYADETNVPNLGFTSYSDNANGRTQSFSSYSENGNAGEQTFTSYGKNGNGPTNVFASYGTESNVVGSGFSNYAETANAANDTFKGYGIAANAADIGFSNYGKSFNEGTDTFTTYAKSSDGETKVGFTSYGVNNTFKDYEKKGTTVSFARYTNISTTLSVSASSVSGSLVNKWVEPGKFFREKMMKEGTVMPMPDIKDKMPERSFLPRSILSKLPFSASDNGSMEKMMKDSLEECERAPSSGETKRCVGSLEDMIDFATSVLGRNVAVRTTQNVNGSKKSVVVGPVRGINGGKVTQSVSCHQSLFPYLLYYCHAVPKVRVYEADLLDPKTKAKINRGVAICHLDTSDWSPTHGAFLSLGSVPGRIEVCHWIFENDMAWTIAD